MSNMKVYLMREKDDDPERYVKIETRRLYINYGTPNGSYGRLSEALQKFFTIPKDQTFTIKWKDIDNDMITISSDHELSIYERDFPPGAPNVMFLYLQNTQHQQKSEPNNFPTSNVVHPMITCDSCEKTVQGFRYKCLICPDYDLCSGCEAKGCHPEHYMIRTANPVSWGRRCMPRFSRRFVRHMKKASSKCHEDGKAPHSSARAEDSPSWMENLVQILADWTNIPAENAKEEAPETAEAAQEEPKPKKSPTSVLNDLRQSPLCDNVIYKMQNLLDNSLQFLDPLGMDVTFDLQPEGARIHVKNGGAKEATAPNAPENGDAEKSSSDSRKSSVGSAEKDAAEAEKASTSARPSEVEGWTFVNANGAAPKQDSVEENDAAPKKTPTPSKTEKPLYPPLPQKFEPEPLYHPDPKIHKAVRTMIEMGFNNDGGWLTQLLISKNGDIAKALDVLQPVRK